jgi:hypothetical protein
LVEQPKVYVQGSSKDTTTGSSDNLLIGITAAVVGIGAIAVGLSLTASSPPPSGSYCSFAELFSSVCKFVFIAVDIEDCLSDSEAAVCRQHPTDTLLRLI